MADDLHAFHIDLLDHEMRRVALVLDACGNAYDPVLVEAGERAAHHRLFSGLDFEQQIIYRQLVAAGVLVDDYARPLD